jgi:hypothetical protein
MLTLLRLHFFLVPNRFGHVLELKFSRAFSAPVKATRGAGGRSADLDRFGHARVFERVGSAENVASSHHRE